MHSANTASKRENSFFGHHWPFAEYQAVSQSFHETFVRLTLQDTTQEHAYGTAQNDNEPIVAYHFTADASEIYRDVAGTESCKRARRMVCDHPQGGCKTTRQCTRGSRSG